MYRIKTRRKLKKLLYLKLYIKCMSIKKSVLVMQASKAGFAIPPQNGIAKIVVLCFAPGFHRTNFIIIFPSLFLTLVSKHRSAVAFLQKSNIDPFCLTILAIFHKQVITMTELLWFNDTCDRLQNPRTDQDYHAKQNTLRDKSLTSYNFPCGLRIKRVKTIKKVSIGKCLCRRLFRQKVEDKEPSQLEFSKKSRTDDGCRDAHERPPPRLLSQASTLILFQM